MNSLKKPKTNQKKSGFKYKTKINLTESKRFKILSQVNGNKCI